MTALARSSDTSVDRRWTRSELKASLRALVGTIAPDGPLPLGAARMVRALQAHFGTNYVPADLAPIGEVELARGVAYPWQRQQLVQALIVGVLIDGAPTRLQLERIQELARALGVEEPGIVDLELYLRGRRWRLRRHLLARFWAIDRLKARIKERGFWRAVVPALLSTVLGRHRDPALAARYAALRQLPEGTLGRGFVDYLAANRFPLPGERGAISDVIVPHDLTHVLGGYGTTPDEEVLVACFTAGHRVGDQLAMVLFVLFQFHLGVRMTPGAKAERGYFDPARVLGAIARGAAMKVDLSGDWDYWRVLQEPTEALRQRYGIARRLWRQVEYR
jgi:hypothetical protein